MCNVCRGKGVLYVDSAIGMTLIQSCEFCSVEERAAIVERCEKRMSEIKNIIQSWREEQAYAKSG
ncbi:hypothetical protein [Mangrovibacillus cuniculi]|uniref:Uncharacterized protein n=1 Tax=Mangrovibacillus cuniculi TaxID=2593652 RepID=A0A7S8CBW9_9BACI|nr:hypothetical protein [Mangrovibacillus cuniculi]QPC47131.1 hypothetical protein G8O30_09205 [Mangrovibacillus cuniculi]